MPVRSIVVMVDGDVGEGGEEEEKEDGEEEEEAICVILPEEMVTLRLGRTVPVAGSTMLALERR